MKKFHLSPALVISLIALFVALGGTSYAAITSLPVNSVGTPQLKNGAVTAPKLAYGQTLPSGKTETGEWGVGNYGDAASGGSSGFATATFQVPLKSALNGSHVIYVPGGVATHCPGAGHADAGYLCVYQGDLFDAQLPNSGNIFNPEITGGPPGAGVHGWAIALHANAPGLWFAGGSFAVTAP
jgi:hypothetical protein